LNTTLHITVEKGNLEIVKFLIDNGIDINIQDKYGNMSFHLAAFNGNLQIVILLIENGAFAKKVTTMETHLYI